MENKCINEPTITNITICKDNVNVCYTTESGLYETKLKLGDSITINYGDISNIKFGGTDNWGKDKLPLYIDYTKGDYECDSVFVDTIEILKIAGDWCKCELINNNKNIKYTALSENPYNVERRAYFYHKTQDNTVKIGYNKGRPVAKEWCVTVIQKANPKGKPINDCDCSKVWFTNGIEFGLDGLDNVRIGILAGDPDSIANVKIFTNNPSVITDFFINDDYEVYARFPKVDRNCIGTIGYKLNNIICKNNIWVKRKA